MYCKYCGNPVDRSTMSCSACGKPVGSLAGGIGLRDLLSGGSRAADNAIPASQTPLAPAAPSPEVKRELSRLSAELREVRDSIPKKKSGVSPILTGLCAAALLLSLISLIVAFLPRDGVNALQLKNLEKRITDLEERFPEQEAMPALEEAQYPEIGGPDNTPSTSTEPENEVPAKEIPQTQSADPTPEQPSEQPVSEQSGTDSEDLTIPTPSPAPLTDDPFFPKHPDPDAPHGYDDRASFICRAAEDGLTYYWEFSHDKSDWEPITNDTPGYTVAPYHSGGSVLTILQTGRDNAGYYRCRVYDSNGIEHVSNSAKLSLKDYDPDDYISSNAVAGGAAGTAASEGSSDTASAFNGFIDQPPTQN